MNEKGLIKVTDIMSLEFDGFINKGVQAYGVTMSQTATQKTRIEIQEDGFILASDIPITGAEEWGQAALDFDKEEYEYKWKTEWMRTNETETGDTLFDVTNVSEGQVLRFNNNNNQSRGSEVGVLSRTENELVIVPLDKKEAECIAAGKESLNTTDTSRDSGSTEVDTTRAQVGAKSSSQSSDTNTPPQMSLSRSERSLPAKSAIVGTDDFDRGDIVEEFEGTQVFGFLLMYTTGTRLLVPRQKVLNKMEDVGLPKWMAPTKVKPYQAFPRACNALLEDGRDELQTAGGYSVKLSVESNGGRYEKMLVASKHIPDEETDVDGGDLDHINVARIEFDNEDSRTLVTSVHEDAKGSELEEVWLDTYKPRLYDLFKSRQEQHNGQDLNEIISSFVTNWTDATRIRDACYFVPTFYRSLQGNLAAFAEFYGWLNRNYKSRGQETEFHYLGVTDNEQHKSVVMSAIEDELEERISDLFDEILEEVIESGELADDIAETVVEETGEMEDLAQKYSVISSARINVKKMMKEHMEGLEDDKKDVLSDVLDGLDV